MKLTIGFATHNDFDGLYFSINALRMYHAEVMPQVELICIDNAPDSPCGQRAKGLFDHINVGIRSGKPGHPFAARWIPFGEIQGTSASRDRIFREAAGDAVLVMDSHVLLAPDAVFSLLDYYTRNPDCMDLLSGPLLLDSLATVYTHFDDVWRDGMWGIWGIDKRILDNPEPLEIPAMGLGLFSCRKDAWLGFNPHFREFGGEEWYIHTKFRQAGRRCICIPDLLWQHRFGDPVGGRKSPLSLHGKVRNFMLGHQELGLSLERLRNHYVYGINEDTGLAESRDGRLTAAQFATLAANPVAYPPLSLFC
jgi:glycosyltransferase involved in cell wall biosynthesis